MRSGYIDVNTGYLKLAGISGHGWDRSGYADTNAYYLDFNASGVRPLSGPGARYFGFSLRCLQE